MADIALSEIHGIPRQESHVSTAVVNRFADFWLLGGASIALWLVMVSGQLFRGHSELIENHFMQVGPIFAMMSIFCNHPHFMISYRFGYGRGTGFIWRHWFSLLAVPLGLIAFYTLAYFRFGTQISDLPSVIFANQVFEHLGLAFRLGTLANLGTEILSFSVLLMNVTVGWHYSKQVFGCIMVYAHYEKYPINPRQRVLLKASLFAVAFFNFFYLAIYTPAYNSSGQGHFLNIPLVSLGLPQLLIPLTAAFVVVCVIGVLGYVFYANYLKFRRWPSLNLIVPWVAFHVWWIPFFRQTEFYFMAIPFFHSLQYLPFAYRLEIPKVKRGKWFDLNLSLRLALLLFIGFSAFELVPSLLDKSLDTTWLFKTWFFVIAFSVFINVHHFFIDSVVWKFDQSDVRDHLFKS